MMKRMLMLIVVLTLIVAGLLTEIAFAQAAGPFGRGMGPGMMGAGMMGRGMMGGWAGQAQAMPCPGMAAAVGQAQPAAVTEEQAKALAQQYADQYLKGFVVERVLPFTMGRGTMYTVELKGPDGQLRTFHVNPWGNVMPFGGPGRRAG
jgi:hypothetical protein